MIVCVYPGHVLAEELHGDPHCSVHEALGEPGVDIQVSDEAHEPDDQEGSGQHHLLSELLHTHIHTHHAKHTQNLEGIRK